VNRAPWPNLDGWFALRRTKARNKTNLWAGGKATPICRYAMKDCKQQFLYHLQYSFVFDELARSLHNRVCQKRRTKACNKTNLWAA
jgi:hypothetical protein